MLLWLVFAMMTAAVVGLLLHPLLVKRDAAAAARDGSSAVYRDQLAEVETEAARGLIGKDEAEAARREIARRLIASASPDATGGVHDKLATLARTSSWAAVAIAALLPIGALAIYLQTGAPGVPAQPVAFRRATPPVNAEVTKLVGAVEGRLKANPEDGRGWDVIAPVYLRLGRYGDAVEAYNHANRLLGENARRLAGVAEARMLADGGRIGPEARGALTRLLDLEPGHVQARFWLAFAKEQDGDLAAAAASYAQLLEAAPRDVSWRPMLEERLQAVRAELGDNSASSGGQSAPGATSGRTEPGPSAAEVAAAEKMLPADRQAMIDGMVSGLAARLEKDGRDLAGWERLIRAYTVLGRKDEAVAALDRARKSLADEPQSLALLADLAKSLGLGT